LESVELFLQQRAVLEGDTPLVLTPLMGAARRGQLNAVEILLKNGANVNAKTQLGWTALTLAAYMGHHNVADLLLDYGAEMTLTDAACLGDLTSVENLIEQGADRNGNCPQYVTPLMCAAHRGHIDVVQNLLKNGADVYVKTKDGDTALTLALLGQVNVNIVKLLLDNGAEVNIRGSGGDTPLRIAQKRHLRKVTELLISHGALR
jgi:ankyrin repeat protein